MITHLTSKRILCHYVVLRGAKQLETSFPFQRYQSKFYLPTSADTHLYSWVKRGAHS